MRATNHIALIALVAGVWTSPGRAAVQTSFEPSLTLSGGADDNVLFDGSGGDGVGTGTVRLLSRAWERGWSTALDAQVTTTTFALRGQTILLGMAEASARTQLGRHASGRLQARLRTADDPLGLAQFGVLGATGRVFTWKTAGTLTQRLDERHQLSAVTTFDGVSFLEPSLQDRGGSALGLAAVLNRRHSRALSPRLALETKAFLMPDLLATSVGLVPGMRVRLARRTFLDVSAGGLAYMDEQGTVPVPIARVRLERDWRRLGVALAAANDLTIPSGRGGVLEGQLFEGVAHWSGHRTEVRARGGYYRSHPQPRDERWVPGWGAEVTAFARVSGPMWLGVGASRFERLETAFAPALARNAVFLRLDVTGGRP